jgi:hypothetical protein
MIKVNRNHHYEDGNQILHHEAIAVRGFVLCLASIDTINPSLA